MFSNSVVWCGRCRDTAEVAAEVYLGPIAECAGFVSCPECPTCPCGMRFSDHKDEAGEFLEAVDLVRAHSQFWAPNCLREYEQEASHGHV